MKLARIGFLLGLSLASISAFAVPAILIAQTRQPIKDGDDPNVDIAQAISHEYDTSGRLNPIVFSLADPIFRAAVTAGDIKNAPENPKPRQIFDAAKKLGVEYILVVEAIRSGKAVKAKAFLYRDRHEIWKDEENMSVTTKDILDPEGTSRSLARTFAIRMNAAPFKGMQDRPKMQTPTLQPGQSPTVAQGSAPISPETSDSQLTKNVEALVQAKKVESAILMLRDAVDAAPFDLDRRMSLINLLQGDNPEAAATEARHAAALMPDKIELRVLAARAWMKAGHPEEAQKDLNEAIARDPNGPDTRLLLAEVSLEQLAPAKALGHLDESIKQKDSAQARFLRAICRALLGGVEGMQADLAQTDKLDPNKTPDSTRQRYSIAVDITDRMLAQDGAEIRTLIPKIVVKPKDKDLHEQIDQSLRLIQSRTMFLSALPLPPEAKQANDRRLLAQKLMAQSLLDIQIYSSSMDEDTLADARINLTEALKQIADLRGH